MRRIHVIAHDNKGGRDTPSRGLDLTRPQWRLDSHARFVTQKQSDSNVGR